MSQQELLTRVVEGLRGLGIEFMLTGSHASSLQGEARTTHDIDLVVDLKSKDVRALLEVFRDDQFYLSETAVSDAVAAKGMFNLLETVTGEKVDFWVLTDSAFDQSRFSRRQEVDIGDLLVDVSAPEDTILMKLLWCKQSGGSEKQFNDVLHVYELQAELLDEAYIRKWARDLGVDDLWQRVLAEAEPFDPPDEPAP